jgi:hypothetical protein
MAAKAIGPRLQRQFFVYFSACRKQGWADIYDKIKLDMHVPIWKSNESDMTNPRAPGRSFLP